MHAIADSRDAEEWIGVESMLSVPGWEHAESDTAPAEAERAPATRMSLERGRPQARCDGQEGNPQA